MCVSIGASSWLSQTNLPALTLPYALMGLALRAGVVGGTAGVTGAGVVGGVGVDNSVLQDQVRVADMVISSVI